MNDIAPGISRDAIAAWMNARVEAIDPPLSFYLVEGGRSNLTYIVEDDAKRRWVLRRPPLGSLLPSAHDVSREYRIMHSLAGTSVPVPRMIDLETDAAIIGSPFFMMEYIKGDVVRTKGDAQSLLNREQRALAGVSLIDALAELHSVDPHDVGLADLADPENYIDRQLHIWQKQLRRGREQHSARDLPILDEVHDILAERVPEQQSNGIVHGDYRLENVIVSSSGQVRAVLDWELTTLGDPRADLGLLMVCWPQHDEEIVPLVCEASTVEGFLPRERLIDRYRSRSTVSLSELPYFIGFGLWRLAIILEGVRARYAAGAYGQDAGSEWQVLDDAIVQLAKRARSIL